MKVKKEGLHFKKIKLFFHQPVSGDVENSEDDGGVKISEPNIFPENENLQSFQIESVHQPNQQAENNSIHDEHKKSGGEKSNRHRDKFQKWFYKNIQKSECDSCNYKNGEIGFRFRGAARHRLAHEAEVDEEVVDEIQPDRIRDDEEDCSTNHFKVCSFQFSVGSLFEKQNFRHLLSANFLHSEFYFREGIFRVRQINFSRNFFRESLGGDVFFEFFQNSVGAFEL